MRTGNSVFGSVVPLLKFDTLSPIVGFEVFTCVSAFLPFWPFNNARSQKITEVSWADTSSFTDENMPLNFRTVCPIKTRVFKSWHFIFFHFFCSVLQHFGQHLFLKVLINKLTCYSVISKHVALCMKWCRYMPGASVNVHKRQNGDKWDVMISEYCLSVTLYKSISAHLLACSAQVEADIWCIDSPELNKAVRSDEAARLLLTAQDSLSDVNQWTHLPCAYSQDW